MEHTEVAKETSIMEYLNISVNLRRLFCETLYDRTKGLPRLVHKALEGKYYYDLP
jgi:hypothetical protein